MKKKWRYAIPVPLKKALKWIYYACLDVLDSLMGKRERRYPPRRLNFVGSADFKAVGDEFLAHFKTLGALQPSDRVLDIGSGIGRMAIPLTGYLTDGAYEGFDIDKRGVEWCQKNLMPQYPHFQFQYVDLYNKFYNAQGKIQPAEFRFPYDDCQFDFVFATSVFTHLLPLDAQHYLAEIKRVLAPGGTAFLTWFLLDDEAKKLMKTENSNANFSYPYPGTNFCWHSHPDNPEAEIAYTRNWLKSQLEEVEIYPGSWCGRAGMSYQDIVVWRLS